MTNLDPSKRFGDESVSALAAESAERGFIDAFYEVAAILNIGARPSSPQVVWEQEMLPSLRALAALTPMTPLVLDREAVARIVKGARLSAAFGREFRTGDGRLDDVDLDAADSIIALTSQAGGLDGWVVGSGDGKRWRTWKDGGSDWTDNLVEATRYARREDAEAVHAEDMDAWSIVTYASAIRASNPSVGDGV